MAKIYIDNAKYMEFVSDIAHMMVEQSFNIEDIWNDGVYHDEAQEYFNDKYDEVETMLNKTLNIHSNEHFNTDN
jgi:hypothetical protein